MKATFERNYPRVGSVVVAAGYLLIHGNFDFISRDALTNLFTAMVSVAAIAVGFLATAQSILFSLESKRVTQFLKDAGSFKALVDYMMEAIHLSFALAAISAFALLIDPKAHRWWYPFGFAAWLFVLSYAGLGYYRVVSIFAAILRSPD
ncbi:MAG TPA: hypothetical protein VGG14_16485 [Candidatus Sulfotelmatobacter sp.]